MDLRERVIDFVRENPGCSSNRISGEVPGRDNDIITILRAMHADGTVENRGTPKAAKWWPVNVEFSIEQTGADEIDVDELKARRKVQFAAKKKSETDGALTQVKVNLDGPVAICFFGDPHIDDDGTDIEALEHHVEVCNKTRGMFAGNLGDSSNNWVGRLARLYGEQSTSAAEAWALAEWLIGSTEWLFVVAGNHDLWSGSGDPIKWMSRQAGALYKETAVRLALQFPNKREVRVNIRHDFAGNSQWNPAHGPMKAAQFGVRDHILACGHKHKSGYGVIKDPETGIISHAAQVASFKIFDRYARERGFRDQHISPSITAVIDPYESDPGSLVQMFWSVDKAARYLDMLRAPFDKSEAA